MVRLMGPTEGRQMVSLSQTDIGGHLSFRGPDQSVRVGTAEGNNAAQFLATIGASDHIVLSLTKDEAGLSLGKSWEEIKLKTTRGRGKIPAFTMSRRGRPVWELED
jgi:hypothetical protein